MEGPRSHVVPYKGTCRVSVGSVDKAMDKVLTPKYLPCLVEAQLFLGWRCLGLVQEFRRFHIVR